MKQLDRTLQIGKILHIKANRQKNTKARDYMTLSTNALTGKYTGGKPVTILEKNLQTKFTLAL